MSTANVLAYQATVDKQYTTAKTDTNNNNNPES